MRDEPTVVGVRTRTRTAGYWAVGAVVLLSVLGLIAFFRLGYWLEAPGQSPARADVIILLGGNSKSRLQTGMELYRQGLAPRILLIGEASPDPPSAHPLPNVRLLYLLEENVPRDAILVDARARSSYEEAIDARSMMRQHGWSRALVVSDPPHMRRLSWIWRKTFRGIDSTYLLIPTHPLWWNAGTWWRDDWAQRFVLTEIIKIGYYFALHGR